MTFCGYGRLTKAEITESLHTPLPKGTVLCSDGHVSYKGYAMDNHIEHVVIRADLGRHVKRGFSIYNMSIPCITGSRNGLTEHFGA